MKRNLSFAIALATLVPAAAFAEVNWYGKANVSFDHNSIEGLAQTSESLSYTSLASNASRLGVKGSEVVAEGVSAIYQFEYEVSVDDGDNKGQTLTQRNIFVGVKGGFGQVIAGNFDTPLKSAQNKVDLFNDLHGDIKNVITLNDFRAKNVVMYSSPSSSSLGANVAYINSEIDGVDAGISTSVTFSADTFYAALAYDKDVLLPGITTLRGVLQATFGAIQVGALYETSDADGISGSFDGYLVSFAADISKKTTLKAQFGSSDQVEENGETISLGVDFNYTKNFKSFVYYTQESSDDDLIDSRYLGVGMELKF